MEPEPFDRAVEQAVLAGLIVSLATHGWALATRRYARLLTHERLRVHAGVRLVWGEPLVRCGAAVAIAAAGGAGFKALGMPSSPSPSGMSSPVCSTGWTTHEKSPQKLALT